MTLTNSAHPRRQFLTRLAAAGAGVYFSSCGGKQGAAAPARTAALAGGGPERCRWTQGRRPQPLHVAHLVQGTQGGRPRAGLPDRGQRGELAEYLKKPAEPDSKLDQIRRFYDDCAQTSNPVAMGALKQVVGIDQMVFGTDFPYTTMVEHIMSLPAAHAT